MKRNCLFRANTPSARKAGGESVSSPFRAAQAKDDRTDEALMSALQQGDMTAMETLYERYGRLVGHLLYGAAPGLPPQEIEDLRHDVFIALHKSASRFCAGARFRPWLYGFCRNLARERRRKFAIRQRLYHVFKGAQQDSAIASRTPEEEVLTRRDVLGALAKLPELQRQIFILHEAESLSGEEIGDMLGMNANTVWTHIRAARAAVYEKS